MKSIVAGSDESSKTPHSERTLGPDKGHALTYEMVSGHEDLLWPRVRVGSQEECWPCEGNLPTYQHVSISSIRKAPLLAHRVAYALMVDDIPGGMTVDHVCCQPRCCNPDHLQLLTAAENRALVDVRRGPRLHCRNGHPWSRIEADGRHVCLTCRNDALRRYRSNKRRRALA